MDPAGSGLRARQGNAPRPSDAVLLRAGEGRNGLDELALTWEFRKGLDPRKVKEIVAHGAT